MTPTSRPRVALYIRTEHTDPAAAARQEAALRELARWNCWTDPELITEASPTRVAVPTLERLAEFDVVAVAELSCLASDPLGMRVAAHRLVAGRTRELVTPGQHHDLTEDGAAVVLSYRLELEDLERRVHAAQDPQRVHVVPPDQLNAALAQYAGPEHPTS